MFTITATALGLSKLSNFVNDVLQLTCRLILLQGKQPPCSLVAECAKSTADKESWHVGLVIPCIREYKVDLKDKKEGFKSYKTSYDS